MEKKNRQIKFVASRTNNKIYLQIKVKLEFKHVHIRMPWNFTKWGIKTIHCERIHIILACMKVMSPILIYRTRRIIQIVIIKMWIAQSIHVRRY